MRDNATLFRDTDASDDGGLAANNVARWDLKIRECKREAKSGRGGQRGCTGIISVRLAKSTYWMGWEKKELNEQNKKAVHCKGLCAWIRRHQIRRPHEAIKKGGWCRLVSPCPSMLASWVLTMRPR